MKPAKASLPSESEVLVERSFDAPVDLVWRAYVEPDLLRRWCGGYPGWSMPVCDMDMRVGGRYQWRWRNDEDGMEFGFTGEILEIVQHARIVHTQLFDPGNMGISMGGEPSIVSVTFREAGEITTVATTIKYASKSDRDEAVATGMTDGMEMNYKRLDKMLGEM